MKNVALITGASGGIGRELALIHARYGDLIIIARSEDKLNELKAEIIKTHKREVMVIVKDLSKRESTAEIYALIKSQNIEVNILINNAGFGGVGKFYERNWDEDQKMIDVNINALTSLTRYILPDMVSRDKGRILNVASTAGFMPGPLQAVYFATKAFVVSFSQAIAEELHDTKITVTALCPGPVDTNFGKTANLEGTKLFSNLEDSPTVAQKGYNAMKEGRMIEITRYSMKVGINLGIPFTPNKLLLKTVRKLQEK